MSNLMLGNIDIISRYDMREARRLAYSVHDKIGEMYQVGAGQWRIQFRPDVLRLINYYNDQLRRSEQNLLDYYKETINMTKLGYFLDNRLINNSYERQLFLLYQDGIVFEDYYDYPRLLMQFNP